MGLKREVQGQSVTIDELSRTWEKLNYSDFCIFSDATSLRETTHSVQISLLNVKSGSSSQCPVKLSI